MAWFCHVIWGYVSFYVSDAEPQMSEMRQVMLSSSPNKAELLSTNSISAIIRFDPAVAKRRFYLENPMTWKWSITK